MKPKAQKQETHAARFLCFFFVFFHGDWCRPSALCPSDRDVTQSHRPGHP